mmetsp:Transcript_14164/g.20227  ORF Transcript_14164/g.20227 Transcript_14164/m.20227 type:complete len:205 (+) Transcript_14164:95-709(+)
MMKSTSTTILVLLACHINFASGAFSIPNGQVLPNSPSSTSLNVEAMDRRSMFSFMTRSITASSVLGILGRPNYANAEVAAGTSLPDGAAQFSRLLRLKSDIAAVAKRVSENADSIDKKEWDNISDFLRILYKGGDDMKVVAKGIYDPEKKKRAEEDIKALQKIAQAGDIPVSKQDAQGFLVVTKNSATIIDDFFDLLRDVPDEI